MRKRFIYFLAPILALLFSTAVYAKQQSQQNVALPSNETVKGDYLVAGGTVSISGTVTSDAYVAGGTVIMDGTINGDLLVAGGTVNVSGHVLGNIRAAGGNVILSGEVDKNVTVAGGNVDLTSSSKVHGNVVTASGNSNLAGVIDGNVRGAAGNLVISNMVGGSVDIAVGQLQLTSKGVVSGDLTYQSRNDVIMDSGASVKGTATKKAPPTINTNERGINWALQVLSLLSSLIVAFLLFRLFPQASQRVADTLERRPLAALGMGLVVLIVVPFAILLTLATVVGIPIALIALAAYATSLYLAKFFVALWAGRWLAREFKVDINWVMAGLIGVLVYWALSLIPIISFVVTLLALLLGLGAMVISRRPITKA